jgi:hypothetical protein
LVAWGALSLLGAESPADAAAAIAFGVAAFLDLLTGYVAGDALVSQLHPTSAGDTPALAELAADRRRRSWLAAGAALAATLATAALITQSVYLSVVLTLALMLLSASVFTSGTEGSTRRERVAVRELAESFDRLGFEVRRDPRTGDAAVDPLAASVDLVAFSSHRAFAVQVKAGSKDDTVAPSSAGALTAAASAMSSLLDLPEGVKLEPMLVLAGPRPHEALVHFCNDNRISLVTLPQGNIETAALREALDRMAAAAASEMEAV